MRGIVLGILASFECRLTIAHMGVCDRMREFSGLTLVSDILCAWSSEYGTKCAEGSSWDASDGRSVVAKRRCRAGRCVGHRGPGLSLGGAATGFSQSPARVLAAGLFELVIHRLCRTERVRRPSGRCAADRVARPYAPLECTSQHASLALPHVLSPVVANS